ncbi:uncharacterized protein LOC130662941 isoform X1 [Microplitis mediator]|uniref:uncharacterized protein LOC130662941 isoform X1 n=1 Tax=Microplitis mediator TaxID=375433 RepID=UPI0025538F8C|nr:uncharacterized protein LOC130662941 isoform X1 [Microplitis mediator]
MVRNRRSLRTRRRVPRPNRIQSLPDRIFDGYRFRFEKTMKNGDRRFHCSGKEAYACRAEGTLSTSDEFSYVRRRDQHSHERDPNAEIKARFEKDLHSATQRQFRKLRLIYNDVSLLHQEAAALVTFEEVKRRMQYWQKKPNLAHIISLGSLSYHLHKSEYQNIILHDLGKTDFKFMMNNNNQRYAVLFGDMELINRIDNQSLFIQSTTKVLPQDIINSLQVVSIFTTYADHTFPLLWIIMLEKNEDTCKKIFDEGLRFFKQTLAPIKVYTDFDNDITKAINGAFPEAEVQGTFLSHFTIMINAANSFNINLADPTNQLIFGKIVAISLLPADKIVEAFRWVVSSMDDVYYVQFKSLLDYYSQHWLSGVKPQNYSFYNKADCLLKNSDLIIKNMAYHLRQNPNIWNFISQYFERFLCSFLSFSLFLFLSQLCLLCLGTMLFIIFSAIFLYTKFQEQASFMNYQSHYHLNNLNSKGKINWSTNRIKNIFNSRKKYLLILNSWSEIRAELIDLQTFIKRMGTVLKKVLRDLQYSGLETLPNFQLLNLSTEHQIMQVGDISRTPDNTLLEEASLEELRFSNQRNEPDNIEDDDEDEFPPGLQDEVTNEEELEEDSLVQEISSEENENEEVIAAEIIEELELEETLAEDNSNQEVMAVEIIEEPELEEILAEDNSNQEVMAAEMIEELELEETLAEDNSNQEVMAVEIIEEPELEEILAEDNSNQEVMAAEIIEEPELEETLAEDNSNQGEIAAETVGDQHNGNSERCLRGVIISNGCRFCLVNSPNIRYRPCNHVIACDECQKTYVRKCVEANKLCTCILCSSNIELAEHFDCQNLIM